MRRLDRVLEESVAAGRTPGLMVGVATRDGVAYEGAAGLRALGGEAAMTTDTVFRAFSMTKLVGAVAAAQAIEDGLLTLDTPVEEVLPEWREVQVLEGFDEAGQPILRAPKTRATLRHLATHTSGLVYEFWNANQAKYMEATGAPTILSGLKAALLSYPLAFDPGARWDYGVGPDWLGRMVEEAAGEGIDVWCRRRILDPLGMGDTGFELEPHMADRLVQAHMNAKSGWRAHRIAPPAKPEFYGMGHALYTTGPDYLRFLRMLLAGGALDGEQVLKPESMALFTENQIGDLAAGRMTSAMPPLSADVDFFPEQVNRHSFGALMNTADIEGRRRAGAQSWAGVLNTHYWFDPKADIAAVIMMQHLPFADAACMTVYDAVERAVYAASA